MFWLRHFVRRSLERFTRKRRAEGEDDNPLPLGFTFLCPRDSGLYYGVLQTWTEDFDIKEVEGYDVASELRDALTKQVKRESPTKAQSLTEIQAETPRSAGGLG